MTKFGAMVQLEPEKAKKAALKAVEAAGGNRSEAARRLGIRHRAFVRYLDALEMRAEVDEKWPPQPGRRAVKLAEAS